MCEDIQRWMKDRRGVGAVNQLRTATRKSSASVQRHRSIPAMDAAQTNRSFLTLQRKMQLDKTSNLTIKIYWECQNSILFLIMYSGFKLLFHLISVQGFF
jgi:hypothetical protein